MVAASSKLHQPLGHDRRGDHEALGCVESLDDFGHPMLNTAKLCCAGDVMAVSRVLKNVGALAIAAAAAFGLSYCSETPKYRFAEMASKGSEAIPGSRLINSLKSIDLTSPFSWFWPATTTWVYARPEPTIPNRFYIMSLVYKERPAVLLVDTDCAHRTEYRYAQDEPESADPARDVFGQPVVGPNGKVFRHFKSTIAPSTAELHALCDIDWTSQRKAAAAPRS